MHEIRVDIEKNRIYIIIGTIVKGEAKEIYEEIRDVVSKLKEGFTSITDITQFVPTEPDETYYADKILETLANAGLSKGVRVTGRPVERRNEAVTEFGYVVEVAETVEDAEKYLDEG